MGMAAASPRSAIRKIGILSLRERTNFDAGPRARAWSLSSPSVQSISIAWIAESEVDHRRAVFGRRRLDDFDAAALHSFTSARAARPSAVGLPSSSSTTSARKLMRLMLRGSCTTPYSVRYRSGSGDSTGRSARRRRRACRTTSRTGRRSQVRRRSGSGASPPAGGSRRRRAPGQGERLIGELGRDRQLSRAPVDRASRARALAEERVDLRSSSACRRRSRHGTIRID